MDFSETLLFGNSLGVIVLSVIVAIIGGGARVFAIRRRNRK
jgi:hypothetical protein